MKQALLLLLAPLLVGCAQMRVSVEIFDTEYKNSTPFVAAEVESAVPKVKQQLTGDLDRTQMRMVETANRTLKSLHGAVAEPAARPGAPASTSPSDEMFNRLADDVQIKIASSFNLARQAYLDGIAAADVAHGINWRPGDPESKPRRDNYLLARSKFEEGDRILWDIRHTIYTELSALADTMNTDTTPAKTAHKRTRIVNDADTQLVQQIQSLTAGHDIFDDPQAPLVVGAPPEAWTGTFNRTYGIGILGNTDIAVMMEDAGNFTLKGVRNDATKVTAATFQTVDLLVKTVAAFEGISVPSTATTSSSGGDTTSTGGTDSGTASSSTPAAPSTENHQRRLAAARDILDAIARDAAAFDAPGNADADKAARAAAVKRVNDRLQSNHAELAPAQ